MLHACLMTLMFMAPPADDAPTPGPAGCFLQVGQRVLMVRDVWSERWGLPGGVHNPGETGMRTAERETFEECGLRVTAHEHLFTFPSGFSVYRCEPNANGIPMHGDGAVVLPKAGYDELIEARLLNLRDIPDRELRFVSQRAALFGMMAPTGLPDSVLRPVPRPGPLFYDELPMIRLLQHAVDRATGSMSNDIMRACSQLGNTATVMVVIIGVWFFVGWRAGVELTYALFLTCLVSLVAKQYFGWPRPFHVDPALQRDVAGSFGFPSGHTVCAAALFGLSAQRLQWRGRWLFCVLLVSACALSRVVLGVHYIHDVVGGAALSAAAVWAYHAHRAYHRCTHIALRTWRFAALGVGVLTLALHPQPPAIGVCALLLGVTLGTWGLERRDAPLASQPAHWTFPGDGQRRLLWASVALVLALGVLHGAKLLVPDESSFVPLLGIRIGTDLLLGLLLPAVEATAHLLQRPGACAGRLA